MLYMLNFSFFNICNDPLEIHFKSDCANKTQPMQTIFAGKQNESVQIMNFNVQGFIKFVERFSYYIAVDIISSPGYYFR